jgi:hypothetical protein
MDEVLIMLKQKKIMVSFGLLLIFSGVGCASISDLSRETYQKGFLKGNPIEKQKTIVLEMTGEGSASDHLAAASKIFNQLMQEIAPSVRHISMFPEINPSFSLPETKKILNESSFSPLKKINSVRFILQTHLQRAEVAEGATQVRIEGRLWDMEQGDILWEGFGESRGHLFLFFPTAPASFEKAMEVAGRGLIRKLPIGEK